MVDKTESGAVYRRYAERSPAAVERISQHFGDSAKFDFSPFYDRCGLVFIDASHEYHYVLNDSAEAIKMLAPGGWAIWHDYGIWAGVTEALETLAGQSLAGLRHVRGTSLAVWQRPA